jgi:hypothetical protein
MKNQFLVGWSQMMCTLLLVLLASACERADDWLDVKRNRSDVMPQTVADLQAILDNTIIFNTGYPMLGLVGTDNLYIPDERLAQASIKERNAYLWAADVYQGGSASEFSGPNVKIAYANVVLERLELLDPAMPDYDNVRGQALFLRAYALSALAELFCKPYQVTTAATDPGLQLRQQSDPGQKAQRATVKATYQHMIDDATASLKLLPDRPLYTTRASKAAAAALLARIHLNKGDYLKAYESADLALTYQEELLDFKTIDRKATGVYTFPSYANLHANPEMIFYAEGSLGSATVGDAAIGFIDTLLYGSYKSGDLRRELFFTRNQNGLYQMTGRYTGDYSPFCGISVNELYLIKAEALTRLGDFQSGVLVLNQLLASRYEKNVTLPATPEEQQAALSLILAERRKELPFYGQSRWADLRRLNLESGRQQILLRYSGGAPYQMAPNSLRYVLPYPDQEIQLGGVEQNPR